jgi:hypothetical protein
VGRKESEVVWKELDNLVDDAVHEVAKLIETRFGGTLSAEELESINDALYPVIEELL